MNLLKHQTSYESISPSIALLLLNYTKPDHLCIIQEESCNEGSSSFICVSNSIVEPNFQKIFFKPLVFSLIRVTVLV